MSKKYTLVIETVSKFGSISIFSAETEICRKNVDETRKQSVHLLIIISELLSQAKIGLSEIAEIIVFNGPGNFTGLRVGFSVAKGLAKGLGVPFSASPILEVLLNQNGFAGLRGAFILVGAGKVALQLSDQTAHKIVSLEEFNSILLSLEKIEFLTIKDSFEPVLPFLNISVHSRIKVASDNVTVLYNPLQTKIIKKNEIIYL